MRASIRVCSSRTTEPRARRTARALSLAAWLAASTPAGAELLELEVDRTRDGFDIRFEVTLEVPPDAVRRVFAEPERWAGLSDSVVRSGAVGAAQSGAVPVEIVFRDCILFICRKVRKVVTYHTVESGDIVGAGVSGAGDFRRIEERWQLLPGNGGTHIAFSAHIEPDFRVPPVIGPMLVRSKLKRMLGEMERNLEALEGAVRYGD